MRQIVVCDDIRILIHIHIRVCPRGFPPFYIRNQLPCPQSHPFCIQMQICIVEIPIVKHIIRIVADYRAIQPVRQLFLKGFEFRCFCRYISIPYRISRHKQRRSPPRQISIQLIYPVHSGIPYTGRYDFSLECILIPLPQKGHIAIFIERASCIQPSRILISGPGGMIPKAML